MVFFLSQRAAVSGSIGTHAISGLWSGVGSGSAVIGTLSLDLVDAVEQVLADLDRVIQVAAQMCGHLVFVGGEPVVGGDSL